jgi:predicted nuclease of predicted toxin-antitoxin system
MKLLLDENLSRRIVPFLQNDFPGSSQVALLGLERSDDLTLWNYARENGYTIVTRDADFEEISALRGQPPQVVWIRGHNNSKSALLNLLLTNKSRLIEALNQQGVGCVEIG